MLERLSKLAKYVVKNMLGNAQETQYDISFLFLHRLQR